jgi:hypothetical protein
MNNYILEKRTSETIYYDIDCTLILNTGETITTVISVEADQEGLVILAPAVNGAPVVFPDGTIGAIGKVISVQISEGTIQPKQINQLYTIRAIFNTTLGNIREGTVLLNVTNIPVQTGRVI